MAWTITESIDQMTNTELMGGKAIYRVKLACTADANSATHDLSAATMEIIRGGFVYLAKTSPGAAGDAPSGVYEVSLTDADGDAMLTLSDRSTSAVEFEPGAATIGVYPPIMAQVGVSFDDQIGNGNKTTVYFYIAK